MNTYICINEYTSIDGILFKKDNRYLIYENNDTFFSYVYYSVGENGVELFFDQNVLNDNFISLSEYRENKLNNIL